MMIIYSSGSFFLVRYSLLCLSSDWDIHQCPTGQFGDQRKHNSWICAQANLRKGVGVLPNPHIHSPSVIQLMTFNLKTLSGFLPLWYLLMLPFILLLFCHYLSFYQCIYYWILSGNSLKKLCYTGPSPLIPELKLGDDAVTTWPISSLTSDRRGILLWELFHVPSQQIHRTFNFSEHSFCLCLFTEPTDTSKLPASHVWHRTC